MRIMFTCFDTHAGGFTKFNKNINEQQEIFDTISTAHYEGFDCIDYAWIDIPLHYQYEYDIDKNGNISVMSNEIQIATIIGNYETNYTIETFDGATMSFETLQQAITFASIYEYPEYDNF